MTLYDFEKTCLIHLITPKSHSIEITPITYTIKKNSGKIMTAQFTECVQYM